MFKLCAAVFALRYFVNCVGFQPNIKSVANISSRNKILRHLFVIYISVLTFSGNQAVLTFQSHTSDNLICALC
jgi:hypothetical protein